MSTLPRGGLSFFSPLSYPTAAGTTLSAANNRFIFAKIADKTETLDKVLVYVQSQNGTQANVKGKLQIWNYTNSSLPNAAIGNEVEVANIGANSFVEFSGLNAAMTAGGIYFGVIKNSSLAVGTDYFRPAMITDPIQCLREGNASSSFPYTEWVGTSTDAMTSVTVSALNLSGGYRIYSGNSYSGFPCATVVTADTTNQIYGSAEWGIEITVPDNFFGYIQSGIMTAIKKGTPTGNLFARLRIGESGTPEDSIVPLPNKFITTQSAIPFIWANRFLVSSGQKILFTMKNSAADSSTNCYNGRYVDYHNDTNSLALIPFAARQAYFNGTIWSYTQLKQPLWLMSHAANPMQAQVSTGGSRHIFRGTPFLDNI